MRDVHVDVIHHDAEVVGRHAVGAQQHQVVELGIGEFDRSLDEIVPRHRALFRRAETDYGLHVLGRHESPRLRALGPPAAVVFGLLVPRELLVAQRLELFA